MGNMLVDPMAADQIPAIKRKRQVDSYRSEKNRYKKKI